MSLFIILALLAIVLVVLNADKLVRGFECALFGSYTGNGKHEPCHKTTE